MFRGGDTILRGLDRGIVRANAAGFIKRRKSFFLVTGFLVGGRQDDVRVQCVCVDVESSIQLVDAFVYSSLFYQDTARIHSRDAGGRIHGTE